MNETVFQILSSLRGGDLQAADILAAIGSQGPRTRPPSLAAFYRALKAGIDEGWLEIAGNDASGPGRPRQIYRLTDRGGRALRGEAQRLRDLAALAFG